MWYALLLVGVVFFDQFSKILVAAVAGSAGNTPDGGVHICWVIDNFFEIFYCENNKGMMGLFPEVSNIIFIVASIIILIGICVYLAVSKHRGKWVNTALMLVMGGAVGNLIDRIITEYVRDFIHIIIKIGGKEIFPYVFNVADVALVIGAIMLVIYILFIGKDAVFRRKKKDGDKTKTDDTKATETTTNTTEAQK